MSSLWKCGAVTASHGVGRGGLTLGLRGRLHPIEEVEAADGGGTSGT